MPGCGGSSLNVPRWTECRRVARLQLLAAGFDRLSKKLDEAVRRRAQRLYLGS